MKSFFSIISIIFLASFIFLFQTKNTIAQIPCSECVPYEADCIQNTAPCDINVDECTDDNDCCIEVGEPCRDTSDCCWPAYYECYTGPDTLWLGRCTSIGAEHPCEDYPPRACIPTQFYYDCFSLNDDLDCDDGYLCCEDAAEITPTLDPAEWGCLTDPYFGKCVDYTDVCTNTTTFPADADCPPGQKCVSADAVCTPSSSSIPTVPITPVDYLDPMGRCENGYIDTAIGCLPVNSATAFSAFVLQWALGIGGGIAFLLIIFAGIQITTSAGSPDKIRAGQELLTAAITGLILIIFSVFILDLIGVQILRLPGL